MRRSISVSNLASFLFVTLVVCSPLALSKSMVDNDRLGKYLPAKWRVVTPTYQPPQIEIKLLKGHVSEDEKLFSTIEYIFSNDNNKMSGMVVEVEHRNNGNEVQKEKKKSGLDSRTIIQIPKFLCPPGEKKDRMGNCREVFHLG